MAAAMVCALHGKRPPTTQQPRAQAEAVGTELEGLGGASPEALLQALRATRSQQRKRKKMRGKANRAAREAAAMNVDDGQASPQPVPDIVPTSAGDDQEPGDGGAGLQLANALELQDMEDDRVAQESAAAAAAAATTPELASCSFAVGQDVVMNDGEYESMRGIVIAVEGDRLHIGFSREQQEWYDLPESVWARAASVTLLPPDAGKKKPKTRKQR